MEKYNPSNRHQVTFVLRPGSSDKKSVDETWTKKAYMRPRLPFDVLPGEKWLDLGANIGAFTVYAAYKGAQVVAYEPQIDNVGMITANLVENGLRDRVKITKAAIVPSTQHQTTMDFYESTNPTSYRRHTLYGNYLNSNRKKNVTITQVDCLGFDQVIAGTGYDCIKMNIEGAEIPIIENLLPDTPGRIKKMVFEYSFDMDNRISTYVKLLEKLGTMFEVVKPSRSIPLHLETFPFYPPNCYIFCINGKQNPTG